MEVRKYLDSHYEILENWWKDYNYPPIPKDIIPPHGFIAFENDTPLASSFLYLSDGNGIGFIGFTIVNKSLPGIKRYKAIVAVVDAVKEEAKKNGKSVLYGFSGNDALVGIYLKNGFQTSERDCTSVVFPLLGQDVGFLTE